MNRVIVIGCGGAGKSVFAARLGEKLNIPVYHLDKIFWHTGWIPSDRDTFLARQQDIAAESAWIMDGHYGGTLDYRLDVADTVIFFDYPTLTCLRGAVRRYLAGRGDNTRFDMTEGNPEKLDPGFLWWITRFRATHRPRILEKLSRLRDDQQVFQFVNRDQASRFLLEAGG